MDVEQSSGGWLKLVALILLAALAFATRLPAPWRAEVIGDEMLHLESWRNRYRTDDMMPLFLRRLERHPRFSTSQKDTLRRLYHSSPLFQRLIFVQTEVASPAFGVLAETVESRSHSSLIALRLPSVVFSMATLVLVFYLGRMVRGPELGLWLATLVAIGPLPQIYAGIGRPHALAQFALFGLIAAVVADFKQRPASPARLLLVALAAQTAHWATWAVIGPLVFGALIRRLLEGDSVWTLLRQAWWYALVSIALIGVFFIQATGTSSFSANVYFPGFATLWRYFCIASPFGHLASFGDAGIWASGLAFLALIAWGIRSLFVADDWIRALRWPLLVTVAISLFASFVMCAGVRHMMIYAPVPLFLAALGARALFPSPKAALAGIVATLVAFGAIGLFDAEDPYRYVLSADPRYSEVAARLEAELRPGDPWISYPYFIGSPLYRWHRFPEPTEPLSVSELKDALRDRPADRPCFVLTIPQVVDDEPEMKQALWIVRFSNGIALAKLPPRKTPGPG